MSNKDAFTKPESRHLRIPRTFSFCDNANPTYNKLFMESCKPYFEEPNSESGEEFACAIDQYRQIQFKDNHNLKHTSKMKPIQPHQFVKQKNNKQIELSKIKEQYQLSYRSRQSGSIIKEQLNTDRKSISRLVTNNSQQDMFLLQKEYLNQKNDSNNINNDNNKQQNDTFQNATLETTQINNEDDRNSSQFNFKQQNASHILTTNRNRQNSNASNISHFSAILKLKANLTSIKENIKIMTGQPKILQQQIQINQRSKSNGGNTQQSQNNITERNNTTNTSFSYQKSLLNDNKPIDFRLNCRDNNNYFKSSEVFMPPKNNCPCVKVHDDWTKQYQEFIFKPKINKDKTKEVMPFVEHQTLAETEPKRFINQYMPKYLNVCRNYTNGVKLVLNRKQEDFVNSTKKRSLSQQSILNKDSSVAEVNAQQPRSISVAVLRNMECLNTQQIEELAKAQAQIDDSNFNKFQEFRIKNLKQLEIIKRKETGKSAFTSRLFNEDVEKIFLQKLKTNDKLQREKNTKLSEIARNRLLLQIKTQKAAQAAQDGQEVKAAAVLKSVKQRISNIGLYAPDKQEILVNVQEYLQESKIMKAGREARRKFNLEHNQLKKHQMDVIREITNRVQMVKKHKSPTNK